MVRQTRQERPNASTALDYASNPPHGPRLWLRRSAISELKKPLGGTTYRKGLLGAVATTVVDGDADGGRKLLGDAGSLKLLQGETTTETGLEVVPWVGGRTTGRRAPAVGRGKMALAFFSRDATGLLATSLVEPGLHAAGTGVTLMCEETGEEVSGCSRGEGGAQEGALRRPPRSDFPHGKDSAA